MKRTLIQLLDTEDDKLRASDHKIKSSLFVARVELLSMREAQQRHAQEERSRQCRHNRSRLDCSTNAPEEDHQNTSLHLASTGQTGIWIEWRTWKQNGMSRDQWLTEVLLRVRFSKVWFSAASSSCSSTSLMQGNKAVFASALTQLQIQSRYAMLLGLLSAVH